jgi:hypothetical protein
VFFKKSSGVLALTRSRASSQQHLSNTCLAYIVGNLKQPVLPYHPSTESSSASSIGRSQLYVKKNSQHATSITKKSQIAQLKGVTRRISPPYSSTAFASPPFPSRPRILIPIGRHSEGLLMAMNRRQTREKRAQRKSFITRHPAMTTDWCDVM